MERVAIRRHYGSKAVPLPNLQTAFATNPDMTVSACDGNDRPDLNTILRRKGSNIRAVNNHDGVVGKTKPNAAVSVRERNQRFLSSHFRRGLKSYPAPVL